MPSNRDGKKLTNGVAPTLTRRSLLELAGMAAAAAALPALPAQGKTTRLSPASPPVPANTVGPVMTTLSTYMSEAGGKALPEEVAEKSKQHVLDTFAAMISGSELPPGRVAQGFAREYGGKAVATVVGSNIVCGALEAAMVNGVLAHSDETDDSNGPSHSHPGCAVIPAALAAGERFWNQREPVPEGCGARLRRRMPIHDCTWRSTLRKRESFQHAQYRHNFRRCGSRRLRGKSKRRADASAAGLRGAAMFGADLLAPG